jgi:hypothetical protein
MVRNMSRVTAKTMRYRLERGIVAIPESKEHFSHVTAGGIFLSG